MKVKIMQRSVYHKYAEIEVEIPDGMECNDIHEYLTENDHLYNEEMDEKMDKVEYEDGNGEDEYTGMDDGSENEWRFEVIAKGENYGGHL